MSSKNFFQNAHKGAKVSATAIQTKALEVTYPNGY
jgi:hypothetical protein